MSFRLFRAPSAALTFGLAAIAFVCALAAILAYHNYRSEIRAAERQAVGAAHVIAAHFQWMVQASDQTLRRIDAALGAQPGGADEYTTLHISQAVGDLPAGFQYSVYDASGGLDFSSVPNAAGINVADRQYFEELRNGTVTVVSPLLQERLTGERVFVIGRRLERDGNFAGAATIAVPTAKMWEFWSSIGLGPSSSVSVVRNDGWLVARFPAVEQAMNFSNSPLFQARKSKASGFYHSAVSPADGKSRIVGFWNIDGWPLVAVAGVERGETLAGFWSNFYTGLALAFPILGLMAAGLVGIVKLLKEDESQRRELQTALDQNRFLLREVHHRVKNNLQTVASLVRLQPLPDDARRSISSRIGAMVAVHEQIYAHDQYQRVAVAPYLENLINGILDTFPVKPELDMELESIELDRDRAMALGLLVNEITSNAVKHGVGDRTDGRLKIRLNRNGKNIRLSIADNGSGFDAGSAPRNMGSRLIEAFAGQIGGTFSFTKNGGTVFEIVFPS